MSVDKAKWVISETMANGHKKVFCGDDTSDMYRVRIEQLIESYKLTGIVEYEVTPREDGILGIFIGSREPENDQWLELAEYIHDDITGKEYWECYHEESAPDGAFYFWAARHKGGPIF